jgi:excisionase family DNA binding protein
MHALVVVMDHIDGPLTTGEVAAIFGVTTSTVKRWADAGRLPHFRTPGGHYRFARTDVDRFATMQPATEAVAS